MTIIRRKISCRFFLIIAAVALIHGFTGCKQPLFVETSLFISGEGGYDTYRIPSVIMTTDGTLLAFCEGRKESTSDAGNVDLLLKRSNDGGKSWSKQQHSHSAALIRIRLLSHLKQMQKSGHRIIKH